MEKQNLGIKEKIIGGFVILLIIFGLNGAYIYSSFNTSQGALKDILREKDLSMQNLNRFKFEVLQSVHNTSSLLYKYTSVRTDNNDEENYFNNLHQLKKELLTNRVFWKEDECKKLIKEVMADADKLIAAEALIINSNSDSLSAITFNTTVVPVSKTIIEKTNTVIRIKETEKGLDEKRMAEHFETMKYALFISGVLIATLCLAMGLYTSKIVLSKIKRIGEVTEDLSKGLHPKPISNIKNDEIGKMARSINTLITGLKETTEFAEHIGKGNYEATFTPLSNEDVLGNSLVGMRNNLKKVAEEDKIRNWFNEGNTRFNDLLRNNYKDQKEFAFTILSSLVKYLDANQGMFFVCQNENGEDILEEAAAYAWDKRKFGKTRYTKGEGLAGQVWIEQEYVFMTEVPESYVEIRSGIGLATPRSVIVFPLKYNEQTYGIIELASFKVLTKHEIDFLLKISENIASSLSNSMTSEKMKKLLDETQDKSYQLKEQEESMRQNLEELGATQEDMMRRETELSEKLRTLNIENDFLKEKIKSFES